MRTWTLPPPGGCWRARRADFAPAPCAPLAPVCRCRRQVQRANRNKRAACEPRILTRFNSEDRRKLSQNLAEHPSRSWSFIFGRRFKHAHRRAAADSHEADKDKCTRERGQRAVHPTLPTPSHPRSVSDDFGARDSSFIMQRR